MPKLGFLEVLNKPVSFFLYFLLLGIFSLLFLQSHVSLITILQIFVVLALVIIIATRFNLSKFFTNQKKFFSLLFILPVILFIYFLVFSTGGLSSPFLILTHFFAIGLAFLLSPQIAVSFIASTVILVLGNLAKDPSALTFLEETPFAALLYFVAYIALIPFSYILAKEYKVKEEWVEVLEKQIATSKNQEEELLKNITDAVFVLNPKYELVYLNLQAIKLFKFGREILDKNFFKFFSFKDKDGRALKPYSLPFEQTLSFKVQSVVENIQIQTRDQNYLRVDLKILPVIGEEGALGLILIVKDRTAKEEEEKEDQTTASLALSRFLSFLAQQKEIFYSFEKKSPTGRQIQNLVKQNGVLEILAQDFIYTLKLEAEEIGGLSSFVNISQLTDELIYEEIDHASQLGVKLIGLGGEEERLVQPKTLNIPIGGKSISGYHILGNPSFLHDSIKRLLDLSILLCKKEGEVKIEMGQEKGLVKLQISSVENANAIPREWTDDLFEKFYGRLGNLVELSQTSGFEGFIAKSLIDRMGGNVTVTSKINPPLLIFTITFGIKTADD
jgi:PAS domain-containing protein